MKWLPFELHTHTFHSDGAHSLMEMAHQAHKLGLYGIALTDHNTISGLEDREIVMAKTGVEIIQGLEWTTFYGHMLTLGLQSYADWRDLGPQDIHKGIERIHRQGGIVGIAHPFRLGNPICTGCHWEYEVSNWDDIDYLEVWSVTPASNDNIPAFKLWDSLLNKGHRISATSGRDWHHSNSSDAPVVATYLGITQQENASSIERLVVDAITEGRVSVSAGPLLLCSINADGRQYSLGEVVTLKYNSFTEIDVEIQIDFSVRAELWSIPRQSLRVEIVGKQGILAELKLSHDSTSASFKIQTNELLWLRAQLYGVLNNVSTMISFTNSIYFREEVK